MEALLRALLPRMLPDTCTFQIHPFQGKPDLLSKLQERLYGYARWLPSDSRLVVLVDRNDRDCRELKQGLEGMALRAGLRTRSNPKNTPWQLVNRIVVAELEAWYFGDWLAVRKAFPKVPPSVPSQSKYRDPDDIRGSTWRAFERILKRQNYFKTGLRKVEAARAIGAHLDPSRSRSRSFKRFCDAIAEATAYGETSEKPPA